MSEQPEPVNEKYAYTKLWHPRASVQVSIPIPITAGLSPDDCERLLLSVDNLMAAGWLANVAGTEPGEDVEEVVAVLRRTVDSRSHPSGECPRIALYSSNAGMKWSFLSVYLNTDEEIALFERVSGMRISSIENFVGTAAPARGDKRTDRFIVQAPRPFKVVLRNNPDYDEAKAEAAKSRNEAYTVPKRVFVRWLDAPTGEPCPKSAAPKTAPQTEDRIAKIMVMQWGELAKARDYANGLPVDQGKPFVDAVRNRAFELFKYDASSAKDMDIIVDIEDAAYKSNLYGEPSPEQKRELDAVIKMKRAALVK